MIGPAQGRKSRRDRTRAVADLDELWDFDDPAASETSFRAAIEAGSATDDPIAVAEARTQLARAIGLQGRFDEGHAILDEVDSTHPMSDRVRVRSRLERGRMHRSGGAETASKAPFAEAWELASELGEDGLAVDAAHMLAIVDAPPGAEAWHERALALADASRDPKVRKWRASLWNNIGWARIERGDHAGALQAFETALAARRERGGGKETRIAEWSVAKALRLLGRADEALAIQERVAAEAEAAGDRDEGYGPEEIGECLLLLGRASEARPHLARAAELLGADPWLVEHEPDRIARLRTLGDLG
jgi:tetratricopeptide (TPR) repeat protein